MATIFAGRNRDPRAARAETGGGAQSVGNRLEKRKLSPEYITWASGSSVPRNHTCS